MSIKSYWKECDFLYKSFCRKDGIYILGTRCTRLNRPVNFIHIKKPPYISRVTRFSKCVFSIKIWARLNIKSFTNFFLREIWLDVTNFFPNRSISVEGDSIHTAECVYIWLAYRHIISWNSPKKIPCEKQTNRVWV